MKKLLIVFFVGIGLLAPWIGAIGDEQKPAASGSTFVIGLSPERNIFRQVERYTPLTDYLSAKCGLDVKPKAFTQYKDIIDGFARPGLDGAFLGSFACALAHRKFGAEPVARVEGLDGSSLHHGLLFVRQDSGIKTAKDMKGKRLAFVDSQTVAGYLLPLVYLRSHGIKNYKAFFGETYFAGTHEDVIYDVLEGKADIGAVKSSVYHELADQDSRIQWKLKILSRSPDVPETTFVLRRDLVPSVRTSIGDALLTMHDDPKGREVLKVFGARKFVAASNEEYQPVIDYARQLGINLKKYDFPREQ